MDHDILWTVEAQQERENRTDGSKTYFPCRVIDEPENRDRNIWNMHTVDSGDKTRERKTHRCYINSSHFATML